jgi:hypothetical protein
MATHDEALALTKRLAKLLDRDRPDLAHLDDYYRGDHPLAFASERFRDAFGGLFSAFSDNWVPLVVDAVRQRLHITGFRFDEPDGDTEAWRIWQANSLDMDSDILHTDAMVFGRSYATVGPGDDMDTPLITVESPLNVIVLPCADNRRKRAAALRMFTDECGATMATLYLPDEIWRWRQRGSSMNTGGNWVLRDAASPEPNLLGEVPVVPFLNRPRLDPWGYPEIANVLPLQDAVNKLVADMLVASEYCAMPQRYATGLEIVRDPTTGQARDPFPPISRLWQSEDGETKFGQFPPASLDTYVRAIDLLIQHVASQTATPPHYFYLSGQFPSGESIQSAEAGLVAKATDKTRSFGESWEELMRLAFKVIGDPRSQTTDAETIWADVEVRTESAHVDATLKKLALGIPVEQLWEDLDYTPQQIARFTGLRDAAELRTANAQSVALGLSPQQFTAPLVTAPPAPPTPRMTAQPMPPTPPL